ncbi:MAG: fused MFS/spermidine synthase [Planctomycetes bacterium]|nr:fused MFS/spermidine synthase [Planctomycetota bacterium]
MNRTGCIPLLFSLLVGVGVLTPERCRAQDRKVLFETDGKDRPSPYHHILVDEIDGIRTMRFRRLGTDYEESRYDTRNPLRPVLSYTRLFFSAFLFHPQPKRVLMIGLGGGSVPTLVRHYFPDAVMDTVELDPMVVVAAMACFDFRPDRVFVAEEAARRYFDTGKELLASAGETGSPGDRNRVFVRDGRVQVRLFLAARARYDVVFLDAFRGGYIPFHLTTREFLSQCSGLLTEGGVVALNMRPDFKIYDYHKRTVAAVFPSLFTFGQEGNKICVALPRPRDIPPSQLQKTALELQARHAFTFQIPSLIEELSMETDYEKTGEIFTDDYAPVNVLRGIPRE